MLILRRPVGSITYVIDPEGNRLAVTVERIFYGPPGAPPIVKLSFAGDRKKFVVEREERLATPTAPAA